MPRIPLIEDLTTGPVPPGSNILVVFDPASDWYNASLTIAAEWLRTGGRVHYNVCVQPAANVRSQLNQRGLKVEELERQDALRIYDWYSLMLGRKSSEPYAPSSLKLSELSPTYSSWMKADELGETANTLRVIDNASSTARFNDEKIWVEFILTRQFPRGPIWKATLIDPIVRGLRSEWVYRALEAGADGIIDLKLEESGEEIQNLIRIRNMRNVGFDRKWHSLKTGENFEVILEK